MATGKVDDIFEKNFMTAAKFSVEIENIVKEGDLNYIEAIVQFCEDKNIEMDGISKLISKPLKEKLKFDAQRLNYICLLYTSPSPRDVEESRMPSSA